MMNEGWCQQVRGSIENLLVGLEPPPLLHKKSKCRTRLEIFSSLQICFTNLKPTLMTIQVAIKIIQLNWKLKFKISTQNEW